MSDSTAIPGILTGGTVYEPLCHGRVGARRSNKMLTHGLPLHFGPPGALRRG